MVNLDRARARVALGTMIIAMATSVLPAHAASPNRPSDVVMSKEFRLAVQQAQATIAAGDLAGGGAQAAALMPVSPLEKYAAAGLRMEVASRKSDAQGQRKALTDMLESKAVPPGEEPRLRYLAGYYSFIVGNYEDATAQLDYAKQLGYDPIEATMLRADSNFRKWKKPADGQYIQQGLGYLEQAIERQNAAGKPIPATWFDRAAAFSYKLPDWQGVAKWYQRKLTLYPSPQNWRTGLANYLSAPGMDPQVQLDLYRLQAATGAMASERDYQAYATLAANNGYEAEAKAIIEAGRANGKLPATDAVTVALLKKATPKVKKFIAALPAAEKKAASAANGEPALSVGDAYFSLGQYPQASAQYRLALSKGGVDAARVNTRLGVALARSGDLAGGRAALAQVTGNWANDAAFWNVWLEQQAKVAAAPATTAAPAPAAGAPAS
jgi:tetratricopeptide (TPR) repeat protein